MTNSEVVSKFRELDEELGLLSMLRTLNAADSVVSDLGNTILITSEKGDLEIRTYRNSPEALRALFDLEREMPERDIVLVRADSGEDVRLHSETTFQTPRSSFNW